MAIPEDLRETLRLHSLWLLGMGGEQADLSGADLKELDLTGINLRRAILREVINPQLPQRRAGGFADRMDQDSNGFRYQS